MKTFLLFIIMVMGFGAAIESNYLREEIVQLRHTNDSLQQLVDLNGPTTTIDTTASSDNAVNGTIPNDTLKNGVIR